MNTYTFKLPREEAIRSGILFDVSDSARKAGFSMPVALTRRSFAKFMHVYDEKDLGTIDHTDFVQLPDMLTVCRHAILSSSLSGCAVHFELVTRNGWLSPLSLKVVCELDDDDKPCLTVMLPTEEPD